MIPLFVQEVDLGTELCELLWKENYAKDINCELRIYKFIKKKGRERNKTGKWTEYALTYIKWRAQTKSSKFLTLCLHSLPFTACYLQESLIDRYERSCWVAKFTHTLSIWTLLKYVLFIHHGTQEHFVHFIILRIVPFQRNKMDQDISPWFRF